MATYDRRLVQRLRFAVEPNAAGFGVDLTSDVASNFNDLRHKPTFIERQTMSEADSTVRQRFFQQRDMVFGPDRGQVAIEAYLTSSNEALDSSTSPTKTSQTLLMEAILGGYQGGQGSTVEASPSPTTTTFTVAAGHGSRFAEGQLITVTVSGVEYPCMITDISTDALTIWPALPSAPSAAAAVYNAQNVYLDETDESYLQFLHETQLDRGNIWLMRGCQGDLTLNLNRGGLMTFSTTMTGAVVDHDDEITTPQGGSALAAASYDGTGPLWGTEGGFHFGASGVTTRSLVRCVGITFNPGVSWQEAGDYAGVEGIGEWERDVPDGAITAELTILKNAGDGTYELYEDARKAGTDYGFLWWVGSAAAGEVALCAPTCQIMENVNGVEHNGMEALTVRLLVKENGHTGATATSLQVSPFVMAQL